MRHSLTLRALPLALGSLTLALACGTSQAAPNQILLGASVQLTGPIANTGRYYRDAYELAVDKINKKGGVTVGGKHYTLALKLYDNAQAPQARAQVHCAALC